jgi:hypothetical protein
MNKLWVGQMFLNQMFIGQVAFDQEMWNLKITDSIGKSLFLVFKSLF